MAHSSQGSERTPSLALQALFCCGWAITPIACSPTLHQKNVLEAMRGLGLSLRSPRAGKQGFLHPLRIVSCLRSVLVPGNSQDLQILNLVPRWFPYIA